MGKNRKRMSGGKRRAIKKKWKVRTILERSTESSVEKDNIGEQMDMKAPREEVDAAAVEASVSDLVDRVKWRLARMEERLSRGEGDLERRIKEVKEKLWRLKYLSWLKNRQMRPTTSAQYPAMSESQDPIGTTSRAPGQQPIATDPSRALRNLRKKLRDIEALEVKLVLGKISTPELKQLEKVARRATFSNCFSSGVEIYKRGNLK